MSNNIFQIDLSGCPVLCGGPEADINHDGYCTANKTPSGGSACHWSGCESGRQNCPADYPVYLGLGNQAGCWSDHTQTLCGVEGGSTQPNTPRADVDSVGCPAVCGTPGAVHKGASSWCTTNGQCGWTACQYPNGAGSPPSCSGDYPYFIGTSNFGNNADSCDAGAYKALCSKSPVLPLGNYPQSCTDCSVQLCSDTDATAPDCSGHFCVGNAPCAQGDPVMTCTCAGKPGAEIGLYGHGFGVDYDPSLGLIPGKAPMPTSGTWKGNCSNTGVVRFGVDGGPAPTGTCGGQPCRVGDSFFSATCPPNNTPMTIGLPCPKLPAGAIQGIFVDKYRKELRCGIPPANNCELDPDDKSLTKIYGFPACNAGECSFTGGSPPFCHSDTTDCSGLDKPYYYGYGDSCFAGHRSLCGPYPEGNVAPGCKKQG